MYKLFLKQVIDFFVTLVGLLTISPVFIVVMLLLTVANNGSPFFIQKRIGQKNKVFSIIKFKTMNDKKDASGKLLPDRERLTKVGRFIRATSLDELPQLLNVLKGEMSLIGPRPLLVKYLPLYNDHQIKRHLVKPGITGWAQINGRNAISWEQKFDFDVYYVNNISFFLDIKILWKTLLKVIKKEDINSDVAATMPPFTGSKS